MRSFLPKAESFSDDLLNRSCSVSFLTEIWQKSENKKHEYKIEELLELKGLKYISTPRSGVRRGGGVAIVADTQKFTISKLNIQIPGNLEVVDLKWQANTRQIYLKAMSRMWLLRRLKVAQLEPEVLMEYFVKEITEHGVAIWNSGLTKAQENEIEKIQKVAPKIILN